MKTNATNFKAHLGEYLQKMYEEPVIIEKSGRPAAVLITYKLFKKFSELEDLYWGLLAEEAEKNGFLGPEESERRLKEMARRAGISEDESETA